MTTLHYLIKEILYKNVELSGHPYYQRVVNLNEVILDDEHKQVYYKHINSIIGPLVMVHTHNPSLFRDNTINCTTIRMHGVDADGNTDCNILLYVSLK
jgi:hypothetical protein